MTPIFPTTASANGNGMSTMVLNPAKLSEGHLQAVSSASASANALIDAKAYLSRTARSRLPAPIRSLLPLEKIPGMISLLAGKPNADTYPISGISVQLKPIVGGDTPTTLNIHGQDLEDALQYGPTRGLPALISFLESIVERVHHRKRNQSEWQLTQGIGSLDLLTKAFESILDPQNHLLVEAPAFAGIFPALFTLGINVVSVATDDEGVCPKALAHILDSWPPDKPKPKGLYTTPNGANPSGTTASEQRVRDVLAVCRKHMILIFEDDPYYYLAFDGLGEDPVTRPRNKSYFDIEGQTPGPKGLVLRFDSFSKVLSGGMRLGYFSGHPIFVEAVDKSSANMNLQTSGITQAVALAILEHWQIDGFLRHADRVAAFYRTRRDKFEDAVQRILGGNNGEKPSVAEWVTPKAGMFLWLRLKLPSDVPDSFNVISKEARQAGILAMPGTVFMPLSDDCVYVRTSFSVLKESDFDEACHRLRRVIENLWSERGVELPA